MTGNDDNRDHHGAAWYRQPIAWLGVFVFLASMAGCVWLIVVGTRYADTPLDTPHTVFGVPVSAHSAAAPPTATEPAQ